MGTKLKYGAFPLVAGAVLVVASVIGGITVSGQATTLEAQGTKLDSVTSKVNIARSKTGDLQTAASLKGPGANAARVAADSKTIRELATRALTWNSDATYRKARESTMRVYALAADSKFVTAFLPVAPVNRDSQGNEYPFIDAAGLNSQVGDVTVKLLSVDAVKYSYMALVDVQAKSSDGIGTAVNVATVFVTIDSDGTITKLTGFASTTPPLTSG